MVISLRLIKISYCAYFILEHRLLVNKLWDMKYKDGHSSIIQTLISISPEALMLPDSIPRCLSVPKVPLYRFWNPSSGSS